MVKFKNGDNLSKIRFEVAIADMFEEIFLIENQKDYENVVDFILETVASEGATYAEENDDVYLEPYYPF